MITVLVAQVSNLRAVRSSGSKLAVVMLVASLIGAAAAAPAVAQQPGAGPLTEVWSLQRGQETPNAPGVPISAGPVAYSPVAGEQPRFFAMVLDQRLTVNDASGKEVWSLQLDDEAQPDPAVADVDRDGRAELVLSLSDAVLCVRDGGQVAWRRPVENVLGSPACADVLGDERLEILAADGDGGLTCLDAGGRVLWHLMAESALRPADQDPFLSRLNWDFERYRNRDATAPVAVGDVDGDGQQEILLATEPGFVYCLSGRGEWKWQFRAGSQCVGAPVIADINGDGIPEVLVGSDDRHLHLLDGLTGRPRAAMPTTWGVTASIATADLDGDGKLEVVFGDEAGVLYCCGADGQQRWRINFKQSLSAPEYGDRLVAPPAIADLDGDGDLEMVVGLRARESLYIVSSAGKVEATYPLETGPAVQLAESGVYDTPVVADLDGDGRLEMLVATRLFALHLYRAAAQPEARVAWAGARGNPALTGCMLARCGGPTRNELRRPAGAQVGTIALSYDAASLVDGVVKADLRRPEDVPCVLLTSIRTESGAAEIRIDQVLTSGDAFGVFVEAGDDWPASLRCAEVALADGRVLAEASTKVSLSAVEARKRVHDEALSAAEAAIQSLRLDWPNKVALAAARAAGVEGLTAEPPSAAEWAKRDVKAAAELRELPALTEKQRTRSGLVSLITWAANPWDPFDPGMAWPGLNAAMPAELEISLYRGEYEAAAVNLLNASALPVQVQVAVSGLTAENGVRLPAQEHVVLRETAMVPRSAGDQVGDALVPLSAAGIITVAPMQAAQLWVTVRSGEAAAGLYAGRITLTEMTPRGGQAQLPLRVRVWPVTLPEKSPVRFCTWAYLDGSAFANQIDAAMADLIAHKNTVFTFSAGISAPFDAEGALGDIDWGPLDKLVERYRGHGMMLIQGAEDLRFAGEGSAPSAAYDTAYAGWMRRLAQHFSDQGLAYSDWAIYIVDEPGLEHGPRIKYLLEQGRRIKAADPHIQTYTDPIVVMGPDDLERAAPDVDIWCPEQDSLYRIWGPTPDMHPRERLAIMRGDSSEVWTYECFPRVKRLSPLGYYRHQAWLAWTLGLNGMGFWTYCTSPDNPWTPTKDEYLLVYPGSDGPIPSKRWEACRDGVEDYEALWLARKAVEAAAARGEPGAAAARAEVDALADAVVRERATLPALQRARQRLADMTMALGGAE